MARNSKAFVSLTTHRRFFFLGVTMRELQRTFTKSGFDFELVQAGEKAFWYLKTQNGKKVAYEVWRKKIHKEREMAGKLIEAGEAFPSDESFGKWAWSYPTFEASKAKFDELENEQ